MVSQYQVVSPKHIYIRVTLNRLSRLDVHVEVIIKEKEALNLRQVIRHNGVGGRGGGAVCTLSYMDFLKMFYRVIKHKQNVFLLVYQARQLSYPLV